MSQAGPLSIESNFPPDVPTSFVTDSGTATPSFNVLNILANDTNVNNDNGIQTIGSGDTVTIQLTNRLTGQTTTLNSTPVTIISVPLGSIPGVYYINGDVIAYNLTDTAGAAYSFSGAARTDGTTATEIATEGKDIFEEAAMSNADFTIGVTGNTAYLEVVGLAGKVLNWSALINYRYIG